MSSDHFPSQPISLVLSGGLALGAYQAGLFEALSAAEVEIGWVAGTSIGALNAAIIAGNPPERRVERLRAFWALAIRDLSAGLMPMTSTGMMRHGWNWVNVLGARVAGNRLFRLRVPFDRAVGDVPSLYDNSRLQAALETLIDFDLLNDGPVRLSVVTTDIETGDEVVFDTASPERIEALHLMASGGLAPEFPAVRIGDQLLGDGGLSANTPIDVVLRDPLLADGMRCIAVDLFTRHAPAPRSLEAASERRWDLMFANQTARRLEAIEREYDLRAAVSELAAALPNKARDPRLQALAGEGRRAAVALYMLSCQPSPDEAGDQKIFDFSRQTLADRWHAGRNAAQALLDGPFREPVETGLRVYRLD